MDHWGGKQEAVSCFCNFLKEIIKMYLMASVFALCRHCSQSFKEHSGKWSFIIKITLKWITEGKSEIWRVSTAQNRKMLASHSLGCGTGNINRLINRNYFFFLRLKRFTLNSRRFKKMPVLQAYAEWRTLGLFYIFLMLVLSEQLLLKSCRCHQCGRRVSMSDFSGVCCWAPAFKPFFVSIRNRTTFFFLIFFFFLYRQFMLYLVQFLENYQSVLREEERISVVCFGTVWRVVRKLNFALCIVRKSVAEFLCSPWDVNLNYFS